MKHIKTLLIAWLLSHRFTGAAQVVYPYPEPVIPPYMSSGQYTQYGPGPFSTNYTVTNTASVTIKSGTEITMLPGSDVSGLTGGGNYVGKIADDCGFVLAAFPNWSPNQFDKWEIGIRVPAVVQQKINSFLSNSGGINPYDPDQVKVKCVFQHYHQSDSYTRYGFYYRDYNVVNDTWQEQSTPYTFRVRFAPPKPGLYTLQVTLSTPDSTYQTCFPYFYTVTPSSNKGHLKMANGNLLKMQFTNGDMFFGVGQNIPYAEKQNLPNCASGPCASHAAYEIQRGYINNLADNGGNFTRIRLDAWSNIVEWSYKPILASDPVVNQPLIHYLNNYDLNQRQMWELDRTFDVLEARQVYAILCLLEDQNYSIDTPYDGQHDYTWSKSPYAALLNDATITGCKNFFSDPVAKKYFGKQLYYIMARWGYSTNLAMWEMVNETGNLANTNSQQKLIEADPVFYNDVKNWICDMKYTLEQYYPWHPTTTGFVSDNRSMNMALGCLNVYSSNSYVSYIEKAHSHSYLDDDYEGRADAEQNSSDGYFSNYKPFFWGELGLADSANLIDDYSDREFHNAIWASTFTGGISNGLYWNDWPQKQGVNHRYNFNALRLFTDMIDYTQRLEPGRYKDIGGLGAPYDKREIHTWWMRNGARDYIVGWAKNNSANWTQDLSSFPPAVQSKVVAGSHYYPSTFLDYTCFTTHRNPEMTVNNLLGLTKYKIEIYDAYNGATLLEHKTEWTNTNGTLKFKRRMPSSANNPFYPDYAFIIRTASSSARFANMNRVSYDTLSITEADTVCFQNTEIPNYQNSEISWDLGDRISEDSVQCLHYGKNGTYQVSVTARSKTSDSTLIYTHYIVVTDVKVGKLVRDVTAYPIPASNVLNLDFDERTIVNPSITIYNCIGQQQPFQLIDNHSINTNNFANGVYFLKFKYNAYEKTIKFNILH